MSGSLPSPLTEPRWRTLARIVLIGLATALGALAFQVLVAPRLGAQSPDRSFGYLLLIGADTIGVERITVRDRVWTGDAITRGQGRIVWQAAEVAPGRFSAMDLSAYRTNTDETPFQRVTLGMDGDTAVLTLLTPGTGERRIASRRGAMVLVNSSIAQLAYFAAGRAPGTRDSLPILLASNAQTLMGTIRRDGDTTRFIIAGTETQFYHDASGTITGGLIPAQGLRIVLVEGDALSRVTLGAPSYDAPAGAPYRAEHVTIPSGSHQLAATLTYPAEGAAKVPVVITISGSGPQDRDEYIPVAGGFRPFRQIADTLGRRGIAVLRFDDRGYGASTGDHATATSADFADDVRAIVAWLRARPDVDADRILLLGHSEGGLIAPMVAATDTRIRGLVLMAGPSQRGRDIIYYQQRFAIDRDTTLTSAAQRDSAAAVARAQYDSIVPTRPWWRFFADHDPLPAARQVKAPTLILQGETDRQVTADQAEQLGAAIREGGNRDVTVRVFPRLNHLFLPDPDGNPANYVRLPNGRIAPEVTGLIVDWILEQTR